MSGARLNWCFSYSKRSIFYGSSFGNGTKGPVEGVWQLDLFHLDFDLHRVGERVINGRLADQFLNRGFVHVALDLELHADFAIARSHVLINGQKSPEIDVAFVFAADVLDFQSPARGAIRQRAGHTTGETGKHELHRIRAAVFAQ